MHKQNVRRDPLTWEPLDEPIYLIPTLSIKRRVNWPLITLLAVSTIISVWFIYDIYRLVSLL